MFAGYRIQYWWLFFFFFGPSWIFEKFTFRLFFPHRSGVIDLSLLSRFFIFGVQQFDYDILGILFRFYWVSWTCKFILFTKFRVFSNDFVKTFFLWIIFSPSLYKTPMAKTLGLLILSHRFLKLFIFFYLFLWCS